VSAPERRLTELLGQLEAARVRLEAAADDPEAALAVLAEVNELAQQAAAEVDRAREAILDEDRRA
jgi:hypothetical protein